MIDMKIWANRMADDIIEPKKAFYNNITKPMTLFHLSGHWLIISCYSTFSICSKFFIKTSLYNLD